jgi:hypothetical protein
MQAIMIEMINAVIIPTYIYNMGKRRVEVPS